jgi:hypothetical protein
LKPDADASGGHLLIAVINDETLLEEIITGWLDMGITGATVFDSTDLLQLISRHIPIFAGFRSMTTGGGYHNKTIFTAIDKQDLLENAVTHLEATCRKTGKSSQGVYFVVPLTAFGRLGLEMPADHYQRHIEKKLGRPIPGPSPPPDEAPS